MALNPGSALRSTSPASSNGSSHRGRRLVNTENESLTKDKAFRRYAAGVDRILGLFDTTLQEWADYISFLSRLLKALQNHPENVSIVPRKLTVAKRLAQCLHPSLPSGVHQKALEVYTFIFTFIGEDGLAEDLGLYLPGVASTLTFASISVRPLLLSLIEDYVLKVSTAALRPALKALILTLLPGLEEETSDEFERTLQILNHAKRAFAFSGIGELFWQNLFLASITSSSRRQGALAYLNRHLPKLGEPEADSRVHAEDENFRSTEIATVTTPEPGLLLRCFATGLTDSQGLVQRGFLDLLATHLPMHASIFRRQVAHEDLQLLISAAVGVVLKRDMSLNRRLWSWFLGSDSVGSSKTKLASPDQAGQSDKQHNLESLDLPSYFERYGAQPLILSLESMIVHEPCVPGKMSRPFRIALSLMDRWEIGAPIVDAIFLPLLRSLWAYRRNTTSEEAFEEVFRSANVFFDGVESTLIWSKMLSLVIPADKAKEDILRDLDLAAFIIANFNIREEEMVVLHIPLVCLAMLESLFDSGKCRPDIASTLDDRAVHSSMFHLLTLMIGMISDRAFTIRSNTLLVLETPVAFEGKTNGIRDKVESFFIHNGDGVEGSESPFPAEALGSNFLQLLNPMILKQIHNDVNGANLSRLTQILSVLLKKLSSYDGLDGHALIEALKKRLDVKALRKSRLPFALISSATALFVTLNAQGLQHQVIQSNDRAVLIPMLVQHLWAHLSFSSPQYHIESVQLLEDLQHLAWQEELVTSTILSLVIGTDGRKDTAYQPSTESLERYATLWTHSRNDFGTTSAKSTSEKAPARTRTNDAQVESMAAFSSMLSYSMLSVLSVLRQPDTEANALCRDWLHSLADLSSVFEAVIAPIKNSLSLNNLAEMSIDSLERGSAFIELLSELTAAQSREQWISFSQSSMVKGSDIESPQMHVARLCSAIIQRHEKLGEEATDRQTVRLQRNTLNLMRQLLSNSNPEHLLELQIDDLLVEQLRQPFVLHSSLLQSELLETLLFLLNIKIRIRHSHDVALETTLGEAGLETCRSTRNTSSSSGRAKLSELDVDFMKLLKPPDELLDCLLKGIENPSSYGVIHKWVQVVCESTHLYTFSTVNILMRVVDCFCKQIEVCFSGMKAQYQEQPSADKHFELPVFHLLSGLDFVLTGAHERLVTEEEEMSVVKSPEVQQGFFGSMVSGARTSEAKQPRMARNNNRLTVILCFQDTLRTCFNLWSWHGLENDDLSLSRASWQHASQKLRIRSRRMLEHLISAEPLESIEVLVDVWLKATVGKNTVKAASLLNLVNTLDGSRPSITMAAIFNAIYARNNPTAIVLNQTSTLSSNLEGCDLVTFMNVYVQSLEDDVLGEIWKDCTTFLRDVLGNPMPHRQILTRLVEFIAILSAKMENTNFGDEWKMRRDLADVFARLLTAIFTIKPNSSAAEGTAGASSRVSLIESVGSDTIEDVLDRNFPAFTQLLGESDRLTTIIVSVVSNIIAPLFRSRLFPQNLTYKTLSLFLKVSKTPNTLKAWKKELVDSFSDARFFASAMPLAKEFWLPLLRQLVFAEKGLMAELLSRLNPPAAAGIMFGVGATAARLEADKKAQLNLRRLACVLLAVEDDAFADNFRMIQAKLEELLTASPVSSPSSTTRAEIYMVARALVLKSSSSQMASFWPTLNTELYAAFSSTFDSGDPSSVMYNDYSLLQAAKLLDVLLLINSEDFQTQECLFVTDTVDAIYPPTERGLPALIDEVALTMTESVDPPVSMTTPQPSDNTLALPDEEDHSHRGPLLSGEKTRMIAESDIRRNLLRPFFGQLSIHVYERTYSLSDPDTQACTHDLLADLFNESTVVGS